eukprot:3222325-Amphidinium_carterae.3
MAHPAAAILLFQAHTLVVLARPKTHHSLAQQHQDIAAHLIHYLDRNKVRAEGQEWSVSVNSVVEGGRRHSGYEQINVNKQRGTSHASGSSCWNDKHEDSKRLAHEEMKLSQYAFWSSCWHIVQQNKVNVSSDRFHVRESPGWCNTGNDIKLSVEYYALWPSMLTWLPFWGNMRKTIKFPKCYSLGLTSSQCPMYDSSEPTSRPSSYPLMIQGGAYRSPLSHSGRNGRCILHGHVVTIGNPESLRRRLRRHIETNDAQPRDRPQPIDYMQDEPLEERAQADAELRILRGAIQQQLPSSQYWKHLAFTPGRIPEPVSDQTHAELCRVVLQPAGRVLPDGSGSECVLENTFTQWGVPAERLEQMEEDFRAIAEPHERFPPRDVLEYEAPLDRDQIQTQLRNLREALLQCVDQNAPWVNWGGSIQSPQSNFPQVEEDDQPPASDALCFPQALEMRHGGVNCWKIADSLSGTHEKLLHTDHQRREWNSSQCAVVARVDLPTSPSMTATWQPSSSYSEWSPSSQLQQTTTEKIARPNVQPVTGHAQQSCTPNHIRAFCEAASSLHIGITLQEAVWSLEHFVSSQLQLGSCGTLLANEMRKIQHIAMEYWTGTSAPQVFFKGAALDLAILSTIYRLSITLVDERGLYPLQSLQPHGSPWALIKVTKTDFSFAAVMTTHPSGSVCRSIACDMVQGDPAWDCRTQSMIFDLLVDQPILDSPIKGKTGQPKHSSATISSTEPMNVPS